MNEREAASSDGDALGRVLPIVLAGLAVALGLLAALGDVRGLALALGGALAIPIALRPELGAYLLLIVTPLIVGLERGEFIPLMRPNEALLLLILGAIASRILWRALAGEGYRPALSRIDGVLVLMALCSSIVPLLLRYGRGQPISADDLLFALVLWKYWAVYRLFREAITTPAQVRTCLRLAMAAGLMVAVIAFLQVLQLFGVAEFLWRYYGDPFSGTNEVITSRATSTIAFSFGVADTMVINLVIAIAFGLGAGLRERILLALGGIVFLLGVVAAGQVSGLIGLIVAVLTIGVLSGRLDRLAALGLPAGLAGALLFWPVIETRLAGFGGPHGLPESWVGRLANLQQYVLPELAHGLNWLTGVRPAARIEAPEAWRDFIWIESGYLWLLWIGGLPLLLAFLAFLAVALRELMMVVRSRRDPVQVAAISAFTSLVTIAVLMILDPHLTTRGTADLFFPLLALAFTCRNQNQSMILKNK